jgi:phospholipase/lecithinase/hemolysin
MQANRTLGRTLLVSLILLVCSVFAVAGDYNGVVVYGDSLSDNGNLYAATGFPPPPYWNGRFSNGPVSVEYLAQNLGVPLVDFAWGGATTGIGNSGDGGTQTTLGILGLPGMTTSYLATVGGITPDQAAHSLFMIWGGANDFETDGLSTHTADVAVQDILNIVSGLKGIGVQHILIPGLPDLGLTPQYRDHGLGTVGSQLSAYFNTELLAALQGKGIYYFDTYALLDDVFANPGKYGFTNVTDPCFDGVNVCANPDQYLFWDDLHPTTAADQILAGYFTQVATPEPASLIMLGTGAIGVFGYIRRKAA